MSRQTASHPIYEASRAIYSFLLQAGLHPLPEEVPHWLLVGGGLHTAAAIVLVVAVVVATPTLALVASRTAA